MKKSIAPKIEASSADWISSMFPSLNAGATFILEAMPNIYRRSLYEIDGQFAENELIAILDILEEQGGKISAPTAGRTLPFKIEDLCRDNDEYSESFSNRINDLPRIHLVCLEIWAASFWQQKEKTREEWVEAF